MPNVRRALNKWPLLPEMGAEADAYFASVFYSQAREKDGRIGMRPAFCFYCPKRSAGQPDCATSQEAVL